MERDFHSSAVAAKAGSTIAARDASERAEMARMAASALRYRNSSRKEKKRNVDSVIDVCGQPGRSGQAGRAHGWDINRVGSEADRGGLEAYMADWARLK